MVDGGGPGISGAELQRAVQAAEPAAVLVPPRLVRRAIRHARGLAAIGLRVPHRECYALDGATAVDALGRSRLGLRPDEAPPPTIILIARPHAHELARMTRAEALSLGWRRLFHARVHLALAAKIADGTLSPAAVRERIGCLGDAAFAEARAVLRQEGYLLDPEDDLAVYAEFVAVYLELRSFADTVLPSYFPAIRDFGAIDALLARDVDARPILTATRPAGAISPYARPPEEAGAGAEPPGRGGAPDEPSPGQLRRADRANARGNAVRAAILRTQAARRASPRLAARARAAARAELDQLCGRLRAALDLDADEARRWRGALPALLERSARGGWTAEARLLYDLQAACIDHERGVYAVDLVGWALSLGRRPLRRPLPHQREVLMSKHLRRAARRLASTRLADHDRDRLAPLLRDAVHRSEHRLRDVLRPEIGAALARTGLVPANLPERIALRKLVEELLDGIVRRDFVAMGDLRDALSRSNLKLPDLAGPGEFLRGDRLLKADRRLAVTLDGVYRRGEVYLRALQRLSALAFGTPPGRALTRYVILPFGGSFVLLKGLEHLVELFSKVHVHLCNGASVLTLGAVLLGLPHAENIRWAVLAALRAAYRACRWLLVVLPTRLLLLPPVRWLIENRAVSLAWRWGSRPLALAAATWAVLRLARVPRHASDLAAAGTLLALLPLFNSRLGEDLEEAVVDLAVRAWHRLTSDVLPGLYRLVMEVFGQILEAIDRSLYAVDEWLRFRGGQGRSTLAAKAVLGAAWAVVAYAIRICVNLLIEPQVNPVKHFPVVTVSHKIIFPIMLHLRTPLIRRWPRTGEAIFGTTAFLLPGFFGFLVWELKENWRLYEANRPRTLRPVVIGHHGETMVRLLRPGFHSGTIPKLFARLRRAERGALRSGRRKAALKHLAALDRVEEEIRHFVERDLLALLRDARPAEASGIDVGEIRLATNGVRIELRHPECPGPGVRIAFEERSGSLIAGLADPGWLPGLPSAPRRAVETALAGFFRMAGADLIRDPSDAPDHPMPPLPWQRWVDDWALDPSEPLASVPSPLAGDA